jgi:catechol 2,3-dioxygenase-like lactoylglutathione lyase family enzyme
MESKDIQLLQGIDTVIIRVSNFAASKQWYGEKLGLALLFEDEKMKLAVFDAKGPTSLTIWQTDKKIVRTPDAEALRQEMLARGIHAGETIQDEHVKYFCFYDPDGNVLEACQVHE